MMNNMTERKRINMFVRMMEAAHLPSDFVDWLVDEGFFTQAASTKYHGNYPGGLFDHCFEVTESLVNLTDKMGLQWQNQRSPWIVGMFHDLCKLDSYIKVVDEEGVQMMGCDETDGEILHFVYNPITFFPGHGDKSVMLLSRWMQLTEEEILCIRYHMGAYETKEWDFYDRAIRQYPNVLWTHTADMFASKVKGV